MKRKDSGTKQSPPGAAQRLAELLRTKGVIPYHVDMPDKEFPYVKGSIYGAPKTNELFVKLTNGKVTFVQSIESDLDWPAMADRIFGMDVLDHNAAFALAERMWEKHKNELVLESDQQRPNGRKK